MNSLLSHSIHRLLAAALAVATGAAAAAPYATTYTGQIAASEFGSVYAGQTFSATLVFDNGNASHASQTWGPGDLTCILWRFNNAQSVVYAQDLTATPPNVAAGAAHTDAAGALDNFFSDIRAYVASGAYASTGFVPALGSVDWFINGQNAIFANASGQYRIDAVGSGVSTAPALWSNPAPFTGDCAAPAPASPQATPVPTLGPAGLTLLSGLLGGAAALRRRKALC